MKLRASHVSNSSSSSFIIYGDYVSRDNMIELAAKLGMSEAIVEELKSLSSSYQLRNQFEHLLNEMPGYSGISVSDMDGSTVLGVVKDIECMSSSDMVNGIATQETIDAIDKLCEMFGGTASSFDLEVYC